MCVYVTYMCVYVMRAACACNVCVCVCVCIVMYVCVSCVGHVHVMWL